MPKFEPENELERALMQVASDPSRRADFARILMDADIVVALLPASLVYNAFGHRIVFEMEMALQRACQVLPPHLDSHDNRCFIARKILARIGGGERTFGGLVSAGMAATEELRCQQEHV